MTPTIQGVPEALEYVAGMLSSNTDWEKIKPKKGCERAHLNNDDAAALGVLSEEVYRLREENDALLKATAAMGSKLDDALADRAKIGDRVNQIQDAFSKMHGMFERVFEIIADIQGDSRSMRALLMWYDEREDLVQAALKLLNGYTTHKAVTEWEQEHPKPLLP